MKNKLSNGYIVAYAWGPLKRQRYINDRMEIELANFKFEVAKRFKKSKITEYKFPFKINSESEGSCWVDSHRNKIIKKTGPKEIKMLEQWNTIDNYYKKKRIYKRNKAQDQTPSQGSAAN